MIRNYSLPFKKSVSNSKRRKLFYKLFSKEIPYIPFKDVRKIEDNILTRTEKIIDDFKLSSDIDPLWGIEGIKSIFLRGLNPAATEYTTITAKWLMELLGKKEELKIAELETGSGWSVVTMWNLINNVGRGSMVAIDSSPFAIACTTLMFDYFEIPYKLTLGEDEFEKDFQGVTLFLNDFLKGVKKFPDNYFDAVYSSHGTSYLPFNINTELLKILSKKMKEGTYFITDSLVPKLRMNLNKFKIIKRVIVGNNKDKKFKKRFEIKEGDDVNKIVALYDEPAKGFLDFLHNLMWKDFPTFLGFMKALSKSEDTQRDLYNQVKTPSSRFYSADFKLKDFKPIEVPEKIKLQIPPFVETACLKRE